MNITISSRELATILHALRMIQEHANGPGDCLVGVCEHFDENDELTDAETDALYNKLALLDAVASSPASPFPGAAAAAKMPDGSISTSRFLALCHERDRRPGAPSKAPQ